MKVIFLEDVPRVAKAGEIKEVADGYGRNFLIPKNLAVAADPSALGMVEIQMKRRARIQAQTEAEFMELAKQLDGKEITLKARVGAKERLYGSITSVDIADEIQNSMELVVDKRKIELAEPIHRLGRYEMEIRLAKGIVSHIVVNVVAEEAE